jgi:fatty acid desaturase
MATTEQPPLTPEQLDELGRELDAVLERASREAAGASASKPATTPRPLTPEQYEALGRDFDAVRERVIADLGERDADYIKNLLKVQRALEISGRGLLFFSLLPPAWLAGTTALTLSKVLENLEIGHNVLHGQYDFMNDPEVNSANFEWDTVCPSDQWCHQHNYMHHHYTNIVGKDRDIGYGLIRMFDEQDWHPWYLGNPAWAVWLALFFEYGAAFHDIELAPALVRKSSLRGKGEAVRGVVSKIGKQALKDYVLWPLATGPSAPTTLAANLTANTTRNVWTFLHIMCAHFPEETLAFTEEECIGETRGEWYYRQTVSSANTTWGPLGHILGGNLGFQIEHHLYPDLPAHRYAEIGVEVEEICKRYELPYISGPMSRQFAGVVKKLFRLALPS